MKNIDPTSPLIDPNGVAALLTLPRRSANKIMRQSGFPAAVIDLSPKTRRWSRAAVEKWLADRQRSHSR